MFLPIRTDSPLRSTPYMNWLLIAMNVVMFAAQQVFPNLINSLELHPTSPTVWGFITYQFAHANLLHIGANMLFLYIFGNNVNDKMGHVGYAAFYLAGGIMAGICYVLSEQHGTPIVGASGSIAAITGAYLILFPRSHITMVYMFIFIGKMEIQSMWIILLYFAQDLFLNSAGTDGVAHIAHIGGTIFGSLICLGLVVTHLLPRDQFDVWALIQRWNKRRQYRDLVARGFNPFDYSNSNAPQRSGSRLTDAALEQVQDLRERINAAISQHELSIAADLYVQMKKLDDTQVLSRQAQLDVATQLHHDGHFPQAAEAYESLLKAYPKLDHIEQVELALGILLSRHVKDYERARKHLSRVVDRVHEGKSLDMAKQELALLPAQQLQNS
jgi:membrane associated rhomboid family serine protease